MHIFKVLSLNILAKKHHFLDEKYKKEVNKLHLDFK